MFRHLLIPVDGTVACIVSMGQALELAQSIGARVTFLPLHRSHADEQWTDVNAAATARFADDRAWELLARADAAARAQGVPCTSASASSASSSVAIASTAREHGCDLICIAQLEPALDPGLAHGHAEGVPGATEVPLLICARDRRPVVERAIGILLDQRRSIADTLHMWLDCIRAARARGSVPEWQAMRHFVTRLRDLGAEQHRRGEHARLFRRLRKCTSTADAELAELERLGRRDGQILDELAGKVEDETQYRASFERLEQAVHAYAQLVWERVGREEGVVLPAARRYLREADWAVIVGASDDLIATRPSTRI